LLKRKNQDKQLILGLAVLLHNFQFLAIRKDYNYETKQNHRRIGHNPYRTWDFWNHQLIKYRRVCAASDWRLAGISGDQSRQNCDTCFWPHMHCCWSVFNYVGSFITSIFGTKDGAHIRTSPLLGNLFAYGRSLRHFPWFLPMRYQASGSI